MRIGRIFLGLSGVLLIDSGVRAANFCANTSTEIRQALATAEDNGESDTIKIVAGTYTVSTGTVAFPYVTNQSHALIIEGGYGTGCGRKRERAELTVLSGSDARQVVDLFASSNSTGSISVKNLTIEGGNSAGAGGGMSIGGPTNPLFPPFMGNITVERVIFKLNRSATTPGGLAVNTGNGNVVLRGSLFVFNRCSDSNCSLLVRSLAGPDPISVNFSGNTVALNTCNLGAPTCDSGGARFIGQQQALIYNNLFAFHNGEDLSLQTPAVDAELYFNNIEALVGSPTVEVGTLTESNPEFVDALAEDFRLRATSPVRNQGNAPYPLPSIDLDGRPRVVESAPDLGAYEYQEFLFDDGFEEDL